MRLLIGIIFTLVLNVDAFSQEQDSLTDKVIRMMEAIGTTKMFEVSIENVISLQERSQQELIGNEFWEEFKNEIRKAGFEDLMELLVPIYKKHLTEEEIDAITTFYESEVGKKMVEKFPIISTESMQAGTEWGERLGAKILTGLEENEALKFNQEIEGCKEIKEGKFLSILQDGTEVKIERKGKKQIEIIGEQKNEYEVEWLSDCKYKVYSLNEKKERILNEVLTINIYEIDGDTVKYIFKIDDKEVYKEGEMKIIK